jgi:ClpP class serine protease
LRSANRAIEKKKIEKDIKNFAGNLLGKVKENREIHDQEFQKIVKNNYVDSW